MDIRKKNSDFQFVVSYMMPRLHTGKEWYVSFKAYDPVLKEMRLKRIKINHIEKKNARKMYAADLISRLHEKLRRGWNPWIEKENAKYYTSFTEACNAYRNQIERFCMDGLFRKDTFDSYCSYLRNLKLYNDSLRNPIVYIYQLDMYFLNDFLDYIYIDRKNSPQTRDNYLGWLRSFAKFLKSKGYQKTIITDGIEAFGKRGQKKQRTVIETQDLDQLKSYLESHNKHYLLACYILFYCFVRPKEMSMIRLGDISLKNRTIFISGENSKNRKNAVVTLNKKVIELMLDLEIFNNPSSYYLFSQKCMPGEERFSEKQFRDYWHHHIRKALKFPTEYKFYSLKDTGVTMMLQSGMASINVRDQARHSSILMTDIYTPHDIQEANPMIEKFDSIF
ncbi:MAG: site-specific integrase [Tannerellaceae bacterium]|nr:site-specific integrase [Tannerellaceae bacterium]